MTTLPPYLIAYNALSFASALILSITLLTAVVSKRLYRGKGWFSLMLYWLVYALSYGLLVGKQKGSEPSFGLCYLQTLFIYAAPPLVAAGTLCFYIDFYLGSCWDPTQRRILRPAVTWLILLFPWFLHLAIDIEVIVISVLSKADPVVEKIQSNLYCHLHDNSLPGLVNAAVVVLAMILLIPLEIWTGIQLFRCRRIHQGVEFRQYLSVYLRIAACTIVAAAAFGLSAITLVNAEADNIVQDLSFPCLSMAVALTFASQQDLLNVWLRRKSDLSSLESFDSQSQATDRSLPQPPKTYRSDQTLNLKASSLRPPIQYA